MPLLTGVVTTIQPPTDPVRTLVSRLQGFDSKLIVIGDEKGPADYVLDGVEFLSLSAQLDSRFELARRLPAGHYARKNVGYLVAINQDTNCIFETDDDNAPLQSWMPRQETVEAYKVNQDGWVNVYHSFSAERIWPRGFPLDEINESLRRGLILSEQPATVRAPIQQGLANNSPDVDAIWRLVLDKPFDFQPGPSLHLTPGAWCPFNSQSTWWFPAAYPLLYLPSYCSFRMTDIWRSFIAQRCLWEMGFGLVFHGPEVIQERNPHNLMRDFADEIPGYTRNREFARLLEGLSLANGLDAVGDNLRACYEALVRVEFFPPKEMDLVTAWLSDLGRVMQ